MSQDQSKSGNNQGNNETATLGGGCFWCLEAVYEQLQGVVKVLSGYAGGEVPNPSYKLVCTGTTGHAEVVQITYDPDVISFRDLLEVFFSIHDPTTPNRQGGDVGPQYRSIILYHDQTQKETAEQLIDELEEKDVWSAPIVTQVVPMDKFYVAEDYHQEYFRKNPNQAYCQVVISPKVSKFRGKFSSMLKSEFSAS